MSVVTAWAHLDCVKTQESAIDWQTLSTKIYAVYDLKESWKPIPEDLRNIAEDFDPQTKDLLHLWIAKNTLIAEGQNLGDPSTLPALARTVDAWQDSEAKKIIRIGHNGMHSSSDASYDFLHDSIAVLCRSLADVETCIKYHDTSVSSSLLQFFDRLLEELFEVRRRGVLLPKSAIQYAAKCLLDDGWELSDISQSHLLKAMTDQAAYDFSKGSYGALAGEEMHRLLHGSDFVTSERRERVQDESGQLENPSDPDCAHSYKMSCPGHRCKSS